MPNPDAQKISDAVVNGSPMKHDVWVHGVKFRFIVTTVPGDEGPSVLLVEWYDFSWWSFFGFGPLTEAWMERTTLAVAKTRLLTRLNITMNTRFDSLPAPLLEEFFKWVESLQVEGHTFSEKKLEESAE